MNPFAAPGVPSAHEGIFGPRSRSGGAPRPRKAEAPPPEEAEPYGPEQGLDEEEGKAHEEDVILTALAFAKEVAGFEEKVDISASITLPAKHSHMTRVEFVLYLVDEAGKEQEVGKAEGHAKEGKVRTVFTLPKADPKAAKPERDFHCRAKHKHSKPADGAKVKAKGNVPTDFELEIADAGTAKKDGHAFRMTGEPGKVQKTLQAKDGKEKDGKLLLAFEKLDPSLQYTLEALDSKGNVLGAIFSGKKFGEWSA